MSSSSHSLVSADIVIPNLTSRFAHRARELNIALLSLFHFCTLRTALALFCLVCSFFFGERGGERGRGCGREGCGREGCGRERGDAMPCSALLCDPPSLPAFSGCCIFPAPAPAPAPGAHPFPSALPSSVCVCVVFRKIHASSVAKSRCTYVRADVRFYPILSDCSALE